LRYVGKSVDVAKTIARKSYVDSVQATALTQAQVDTSVNSQLAPYAAKTYVDSQDALNATTSYVDSQDNLRLKLAQKDVANGVPGLGATGKVLASKLNVTVTQRNNRLFWSPSSYPGSNVDVYSGTTVLYTCAISDPGYSYRLLCFASHEVHSADISTYPVIEVRVGSSGGQLIAQGWGPADATYWTGVNVEPYNVNGQTIKTGATTLYVTLYQGGSNGQVTVSTYKPYFYVMAIPS